MTKVAVLLPCYNEEPTIGKVIDDFKRELPEAVIYVYDNNSSDRSKAIALQHGATVVSVHMRGKGNVVRAMFRDIDADCFLMVDSDDTYPAEAARSLIQPILEGSADLVCGDRLSTTYYDINRRKFHNFGNALVCKTIELLFKRKVSDVMTGYRAFSRRFVANFPVINSGFELETEMTIWTLERRLSFMEIPIAYRDRPQGSVSKLNTYQDGFKVICTIIRAVREYRPLLYFGMLSAAAFLLAVGFFVPVLIDYIHTGTVPKFPTLIVCGCAGIAGFIMFICGLILHSIKYHFASLMEFNLRQANRKPPAE